MLAFPHFIEIFTHLVLPFLRRRRILRRVQRTKAPEVLFNRVVKRIHEFVLVTLFEATCKCRAVLEVQNRFPATSRSGQILLVRKPIFFADHFWSRSIQQQMGFSLKITQKGGSHPSCDAELDQFRAQREIS